MRLASKKEEQKRFLFLTLTNPFEKHSDILSHDTVPLKGQKQGDFLFLFSHQLTVIDDSSSE
jgi:hypothetical protein